MGAYNNLNLKGRLRLYFLGVFFGLGSFVWGYVFLLCCYFFFQPILCQSILVRSLTFFVLLKVD